MAGCAGPSDNPLVTVAGWLPYCGGVASITGQASWNMCCCFSLSILSGICATMTGSALPRGARVAHLGRFECYEGGVAAIALGCCWNMGSWLAQGVGPVMAA